METGELEMLLTAKDQACVSIILPTDRVNKKKNYELLKKAVLQAKALLKAKNYADDAKTSLMAKLDKAVTILPTKVQEGVGIYFSPAYSFSFVLPFPVSEKIMVGDDFELRDIFYLKQFIAEYFVLNLTRSAVHLYKASMDNLVEIKDGKFPFIYADDFEYEHAAIADSSAGSLKGYEKEKSQISLLRLKKVFRDADAHLNSYLRKDDTKLLLAGGQKLTSAFLGITTHKDNFFGKVQGSFGNKNFKDFCQLAWNAFVRNKRQEIDHAVEKLLEEDRNHVAEGVKQAWKAALEGKGLTLFVEKDFHRKAYLRSDQFNVTLQPPEKPYKIIPDVVDNLIETIHSKNGKIVFLENDQLKDLGHLALLLRY